MSVKCPKCQFDNPDTQKFCGECGTPLEADVVHTKTLDNQYECSMEYLWIEGEGE